MSEPSPSEIAKVPAGFYVSRHDRPRSGPEVDHWSPSRKPRALVNGPLRHRKSRRNTVNTFFERRTGTNNKGTLAHTVELVHGGLPVTRQEAPGFPQDDAGTVRRRAFARVTGADPLA